MWRACWCSAYWISKYLTIFFSAKCLGHKVWIMMAKVAIEFLSFHKKHPSAVVFYWKKYLYVMAFYKWMIILSTWSLKSSKWLFKRFLIQCMTLYACLLSCFTCVRLFATLWTVARQAPLSMGFSRQDTRVGCHFLLQGIFPTQGLNLCPCVSYVSCIGRRVIYHWATWEAPDPSIQLDNYLMNSIISFLKYKVWYLLLWKWYLS